MSETTIIAKPEQRRLAKMLHAKRQDEISRFVAEEKERIAKQRIEPTPERIAKGDVAQPIVEGVGRRYKTSSPAEYYSGSWPNHVQDAFRWFVLDAHASRHPPVTINYDGTGGGSRGSRMGGLGNVHSTQRDRADRYDWIRGKISEDALEILEWFVSQTRTDEGCHAMTLEGFGQRMFPTVKDKTARRWATLGGLRYAGGELAKYYRLYQVLSGERRREMRVING
jgi:hypothetical protein